MCMIRGVFLAVLIGGTTIGLFTSARADDAAARREIEAVFLRLSQALTRKDSSARRQFLEQRLTADYRGKSPRGSSNRQQLLNRLDQMPWEPDSAARLEIKKLTLHGDQAVALVSGRFVQTSTNPRVTRDRTRQAHQLVTVREERDTLVRTPQGWKIKEREVLKIHRTRDGKPFPPRRPQGPQHGPSAAAIHSE